VGAVEGRLSASSLVMEILMACGRRFVLLAFKSKPLRFGSRTGRGLKPSARCSPVRIIAQLSHG
jgi:hypothetical protein